MVDISSRDEAVGYATYLRDHLEADKAPTKTVSRTVADTVLNW